MRLFTISSALAALLPALSYAQSPALLSTSPARHSLTASRTGAVQLTFSRAVAVPTPIRINTNQRQGLRAGTFGGAGSTLVSFQPTLPFASGEQVSVTVPASVSSPAQVVEFRAATGRGAATFSAPYTVGGALRPQPVASVAGDFDHDGDLDLLVSSYSTSLGQVCLNNGSGQFTAQPATVPIATQGMDLKLGDVNGDGNLDLLACTPSSGGNISLNLGTGQGTFLPSTQPATPGDALALGDFNADGLTDVVAVAPSGSGSLLRFLAGNASGVLTSGAAIALSVPVRRLEAADMDEDGDLDLVLNSGASAVVCLNNGQGVFAMGAVLSINSSYGSLTVGDFNGDGHADVACSCFTSPDVTLLLGTGAGGLQQAQAVAALSRTRHVSSGDLDGDGDLDLLVTNDRGITQTLLNNGQGQFSAASAVLIGYESFNFANAADLNGDGSLDIYTGHSISSPVQHGLDIFFNQPPTVTATAKAGPALNFSLTPNPAHQQVSLTLPQGSGGVSFELRDALGRLVRSWPAQLPIANGTVPLSLANVAPGIYFVLVTTATHRGIQRVEVQ